MIQRLKRLGACLLACALLSGLAAVPASAAGFQDVPAGHWAAESIRRSSPSTASPLSIFTWGPKARGSLSRGGRRRNTSASKARAASSSPNTHTTWTSSAVVSSIPGRAMTPYRAAASQKAAQLPTVLWSVRAAASMPARAHIPARLAGVLSSEPQGDRQEWRCKSKVRVGIKLTAFQQPEGNTCLSPYQAFCGAKP